jgi:hypothetical protein
VHVSAAGVIAMLAGTAFATTRRMSDQARNWWCLRHHEPLDDDAREGDLVFVEGIVRALDETLVAPLSGRECVAYRSRVSDPRTGPFGRQETMQVRPFAIDRDDEEGTIVVDSERAIFGVPPQRLVPRNLDRETSFLARHAISKMRHGGFSEVLVELGARVVVGGTLVLVPRDEPPMNERGFRDLPPPDPQLVGNRGTPLVIVARDL